ncbi:MAG: hypothetical protein ACI87E_000492 [Mariniblastus sp.]|jgi:hypothetical protein
MNLITAASLKSQSSKDLAQLAKKKGVTGWHAMRKEQLVKALLKIAKQKERVKNAQAKLAPAAASKTGARIPKPAIAKSRGTNTKALNGKTESRSKPKSPARESDSAIAKRIRNDRNRKENLKNLSEAVSMALRNQPPEKDRIVLVVRDAYWMQAYWEVTRATVQRAKVALNGHWHNARPVLRLLEITSDGNTNSVENVVQEIPIHSGVNNWYVSTNQPGSKYRIAIGYSVPGGKFHLISKSNQVNPPATSFSEGDEHWTDITNEVEKYYSLSGGYDNKTVSGDLQDVFEEKARQPMHAPAFERLGSGFATGGQGFDFHVDAHMIVHGSTTPRSSVTIGGEPVRIQADGTFALRLELPDKRQVLPVVASSRDGTQQRTTVLAVERNTKIMEPVTRDLEH